MISMKQLTGIIAMILGSAMTCELLVMIWISRFSIEPFRNGMTGIGMIILGVVLIHESHTRQHH